MEDRKKRFGLLLIAKPSLPGTVDGRPRWWLYPLDVSMGFFSSFFSILIEKKKKKRPFTLNRNKKILFKKKMRLWKALRPLHKKRAAPMVLLHHRKASGFAEKYGDIGSLDGHVGLQIRKGDPVARICLSNRAARNALTPRMMCQLDDVVRLLEAKAQEEEPELTSVILSGDGGYFCAGADLSAVKGPLGSPKAGAEMCEFMQLVTSRFVNLPFLTVASIAGGAVGGGSELALSCDFRIMSLTSLFHMKHVKMGLIPGWGGGTRLVERVGRQKALDILVRAKALDAGAARDAGLIDEIFDDAIDAEDAGVQFFKELISEDSSRSALRATKQFVRSSALSTNPSLAVEREIFSKLWGSGDNKDRVDAMLSKLTQKNK